MLHAVAQLGEHTVGDVGGHLGDKVHAHALGADQAHHQLDALDQHLGRIVEQQVGFVKEKSQLRLFKVAHLGQALVQLGEQPQQKGRIQARRLHQLVGGQDIDHAPALGVGLHQVVDVEHGLAKKLRPALGFQLQQAALDGPDAGGRDIAVVGGELFGVVAHVLQHGAQVF